MKPQTLLGIGLRSSGITYLTKKSTNGYNMYKKKESNDFGDTSLTPSIRMVNKTNWTVFLYWGGIMQTRTSLLVTIKKGLSREGPFKWSKFYNHSYFTLTIYKLNFCLKSNSDILSHSDFNRNVELSRFAITFYSLFSLNESDN